jgi:chemotaxis family two-component system sensor kinase Cph1
MPGKSNNGRMNLVDLGTHVCHLYEGERSQKEITIPFLRDGLRQGECCICVADGLPVNSWYRDLEAHGIDVTRARASGALDLVPSGAWRELCHRGSVAMAREVLELVDRQLDAFPAIRIAGDADWASEPAVSPDALCHWEATANVVFGGLPARVICQYDIARYEPAFIHAALRTHPIVLYKGQRLRNPHYESPAILEHEPLLNSCSNDPEVITSMLAQLTAKK